MKISYVLLSLGVAYIIYHGIINTLVILAVFIAFFIGLAWVDSPDFTSSSSSSSSGGTQINFPFSLSPRRGLPEFIKQMWRPNKIENSKIITGSTELDNTLNDILDRLIENHVLIWYQTLTNHPDFTITLRNSALQFLRTFCYRCGEANWIEFLTKKFPDDFASHIRLYRKTLARMQHQNNKDNISIDLNSIFFDLESDMDKTMCRERVCVSREEEKKYLSNVSDLLLYYFLDKPDYDNYILRFLLKDILVSQVLLPVVDLVTDPDYINQCVITWIRDDAYTSEYFLQSCRMSVSVNELEAVLEHANSFTTVLRGFDAGGEEENSVRAQLASLDFLKKLCTARLQRLKEGGIPLEKMELDEVINGNEDRRRGLYNMSYQELMNKDLAVVAFLEFLASRGVQFYIDMYLRIDSYRITASQKLGISSSSSSAALTSSSLSSLSSFSSSSSSSLLINIQEEVRKFARDIFLDFKEKAARAGTFDATYLTELLNKINREPPSENIFDGLQSRLSGILEMDSFFGEFKRSAAYINLLRELDLIPDVTINDDVNGVLGERKSSDTPNDLPPQSLSSLPQFFDPSIQLFAEVTSAEVLREGASGFAVYNIEVSQVDERGNRRVWQIQRRFKNFDDLHKDICEADVKITNLRLPSKRTLNSTSSEIMNKRVQELNQYLQSLLNARVMQSNPSLRPLLHQFLKPGLLENRPSALAKGMSAFIAPIKISVNKVVSMPDQMMDSFSRMIGTNVNRSSSSITWEALNASSNVKVSQGLDQEDASNIPIEIMLLMLDEIFDLRYKNQVVRRGIMNLLRRLVKAFFGGHVSRKIIEKAQNFISASQMAVVLRRFRDKYWPPIASSPVAPPPPSFPTASTARIFSETRDEQAKWRTRVVCRAKLLGSISDELSAFLGKETTRQGVQRLFTMWHNTVLNRRLVHVVIEGVIRELLATRQNHVDTFFHQQHCPLLTNCSIATTTTTKSSSIPSLLDSFPYTNSSFGSGSGAAPSASGVGPRHCQHSVHSNSSSIANNPTLPRSVSASFSSRA